MKNKPEILAPAGSIEAFYAAVKSGADAIYMGGSLFNARRNAKNFNNEELEAAALYARQRDVRLYLTLNTLLFDNEIDKALDFASYASSIGIDGLIVADIGLAAALHKACPKLDLHASTQMTVHNTEGCKALEQIGFTRVVPARELSLQEIEALRASTSLELEIFVHGALCMSVSGQCYLSGLLGGRSGNRGLCAQPCRLPFICAKDEYALSLKELSAIQMMPQFIELGINSIKIEGRMRRPEYVAAAVTACRMMRDTGQLPSDIKELLQNAFSRSGFTNGYLESKLNHDMFGRREEENITASSSSFAPIHAFYKNEFPRVGVDFSLQLTHNSTTLTASDGLNLVTAEGDAPVKAENLDFAAGYEQTARRTLEKTGGTPFFLQSLKLNAQSGMILPSSALGNLRRQALDRLLEAKSYFTPPIFENIPASPQSHTRQSYQLWARCETIQQAQALNISDIKRIILPLKAIKDTKLQALAAQIEILLEPPALAFGDYEQEALADMKQAIKLGFKHFYCENLWSVQAAKDLQAEITIGTYCNIANSLAAGYYQQQGAGAITLSIELTLDQATQIGTSVPTGLVVYGQLPLMKFRNCPVRSRIGCEKCGGVQTLTDRLGNDFPILCNDRHTTSLLNCHPLYTAHKQTAFQRLDYAILYFTIESPEECSSIASAYKNNLPPQGKFTFGSYYKGVE